MSGPPLSHDPACGVCGHPHHLLLCLHDGECLCAYPPVPGSDPTVPEVSE